MTLSPLEAKWPYQETFLKDVDSTMTKIASEIEPRLKAGRVEI